MKFLTRYGTGDIQGNQQKDIGWYLASSKCIKAQTEVGSSSERPKELRDRNVYTLQVPEERSEKGRPHEEIQSVRFDEGDPAKATMWWTFLDAFQGCHQMFMAKEDMEKTSFITEYHIYCWKVMVFGLKNMGPMCQRMVNKVFSTQIGRKMVK
ncbi:hypothetical protein LIER_16518 [Lithospermum erythrorhizon]|uniref:Uncharacterized protein n=1 Tax=Lithospermum erythrorhizon TaxID=34254 RepID=A0AAV3Q8T8_LITER